MKRSNGIELLKFSIEKVSKKYGKWFLKMRGNPVNVAVERNESNKKRASLLLLNLRVRKWSANLGQVFFRLWVRRGLNWRGRSARWSLCPTRWAPVVRKGCLLGSLALRCSRFLIAASVCCFTADSVPVKVTVKLHHVRCPSNKSYHSLTLMVKPPNEAIRSSIKRSP